MWCGVVTLFPEMFQALNYGVTTRAWNNGLQIDYYNPRDYTTDLHKTVDDRPYGGGPGMVMKLAPMLEAVNAGQLQAGNSAKVICMSPQGEKITQADIKNLVAEQQSTIFVAGRYEGVDERFYKLANAIEWSIGDYVLSGGELAIMVILDAIARLLPGVLGHEESAEQDSFCDNLLDHPHYTRPVEFAGELVPEVLLSGDHQSIYNWRLQQRLGRTWRRRPDLLAAKNLTENEQKILTNFIENKR